MSKKARNECGQAEKRTHLNLRFEVTLQQKAVGDFSENL